MAWGVGLVAWILVQWVWLDGTYPVQFFCFAAGLITIVAATVAGAFRPTREPVAATS